MEFLEQNLNQFMSGVRIILENLHDDSILRWMKRQNLTYACLDDATNNNYYSKNQILLVNYGITSIKVNVGASGAITMYYYAIRYILNRILSTSRCFMQLIPKPHFCLARNVEHF